MNAIATRPHPLATQTGHPLKAKPCQCENPLADPREMTCHYCGRQVGGVAIPSTRSHRALGDHSTSAGKRRRTA